MHATIIPPTQPKRAAFIDSIANLSDPLSSMSSMFSLVYLLTLAYQVRTPLPSDQQRLLTLMQTMTMPLTPKSPERHEVSNTHTQRDYTPQEIRNSFIHFLSPVLNGMAGMVEFLSAVDAFSRPEDFREFWNLEQNNLIREFIESGGPLRRCLEGYDVPFLDAFVQDPTCRIALGKNKGALLLVPGDAQVGDDVWWDENEERFTVSRQGEDGMGMNSEGHLDDGSWRAVLEVRSAT